MINTGKYLPRRTVLRGMGVSLALPLLDGMVPAFAALRTSAARPVRRFTATYVGNGMTMQQWTPAKEGPLELTPILQPLERVRDQILVVSGLDNKPSDKVSDGGVHPRIQTAWLTGTLARRSEGRDLYAGTSLDQIAAKEIGQETQLASLEVAMESVDLVGACAFGYSCAYNGTIAWRNPSTPLPMEINPRSVFERLFGASDTTDARARFERMQQNRSILDAVARKAGRLQRSMGPDDQAKIAQYLDAVRDIERRIQRAEQQGDQELPVVERPVGVPNTYEEHAKLLFDMLVLAFQTDMTRVATVMMARELSVRAYPEIGISDAHHPLSHHGDNPDKLGRQAKLNAFHMKMYAYFLEKLQATPDGDGTLLDHTVNLYGAGMSHSNHHTMYNLPSLVAGGKATGIRGDRHLRFGETPLSNLQLTLLEKVGVNVEQFGDSTGELNLLSGV
jgi:hypothetical protein